MNNELVIADRDGVGLDAAVDVGPGMIVLHSRGGAVGSPNARNRDYSNGLRLILERLLENRFDIGKVWVDSSQVQKLSLEERTILTSSDFPANPKALFTLMSRRMQAVGRSKTSGVSRGNSNKRIRFSLEGRSSSEIVQAIGAIPKAMATDIDSRLPVDQLRQVTPEHIWQAIAEIIKEGVGVVFGPSTDYDLLTDNGVRLPPKAVFGRAASLALNLRVGPMSFSAGLGTPCFDILQRVLVTGLLRRPRLQNNGNHFLMTTGSGRKEICDWSAIYAVSAGKAFHARRRPSSCDSTGSCSVRDARWSQCRFSEIKTVMPVSKFTIIRELSPKWKMGI